MPLVCVPIAEPVVRLGIFRYLKRDREGGQVKPLMELMAYQPDRTAFICQDCNLEPDWERSRVGGAES